jgi:hypothetical protein
LLAHAARKVIGAEEVTLPPLSDLLATVRQLRNQGLEPDPSGGGGGRAFARALLPTAGVARMSASPRESMPSMQMPTLPPTPQSCARPTSTGVPFRVFLASMRIRQDGDG